MALVGDARFLKVDTLYSRTGDWFAYLCALGTLAAVVATRRRVLQ
jgi:apolipoprotein N-acyltransferase